MSIASGAKANATNFNTAFVSRTTAQSIAGGKQFSNYVSLTESAVASAATITSLSSSTSKVRLTGSTATELQGVAVGVSGQVLFLYNATNQSVTVKHQNTGASATDRIITFSAGDLTILAGDTVLFTYDATQSRWVQSSSAQAVSSGSGSLTVQSKSANYTAVIDELVICTSGTFTVTLPTAVGVSGRNVIVKNRGTGVISIATTSSQTIDGGASDTVYTLDAKRFASDGSNWVII